METIQENSRTRQLITAAVAFIMAFALTWVLHMLWEWTVEFKPVALVAAVNESVWEHVKILCFAYMAASVVPSFMLKPLPRRLLTARVAGLLVIVTLTICFFYIYSGVLGRSVIWVDIIAAGLWLAAAEIVSLRVLNAGEKADSLFAPAVAVLTLLLTALLCFTVNPPEIGLFRDAETGLYGIH